MLRSMVIAAQFLTRVQLSRRVVEAHELPRALAWFPLVGALVGGAIAGLIVAATPLLGIDVAFLTGAFHEDGLADTCDGLGGGRTRERALEIMRDSRIGSYGAISLILLYAARFTLFRTLGAWQLLLALPAASALGRASIVVLSAWLPSARGEGVGADLASSIGRGTVAIGAITPIIVAAILCGIAAPALVTTAALVIIAAAFYLRHRLGGTTGDALGAVSVIVEVATLVAALAWVRVRAPLEILRWP
jgi:adenosylcobinamide-GDP ribazoletransferase